MAGFITILTEALPAGLLPQMSDSLAISESFRIVQFVTMYAIGCPGRGDPTDGGDRVGGGVPCY